MKPLTTIFFDNDGVLVDTEKLFCEANQVIFDEMGIPHTTEDFQNYQQITNIGSAGFLKRFEFNDQAIKTFKEKRDKIWNKKVEAGHHVVPQAEAVLVQLSKKYRLCMATSASKTHYEWAHQATNILPLFEQVVGRDECQILKPDPEVYLKALELMGVSSDESIVIEDTPRGIASGQAAGVRVVAIRNAFSANLDISSADYVLDSISQLPDLLKGL